MTLPCYGKKSVSFLFLKHSPHTCQSFNTNNQKSRNDEPSKTFMLRSGEVETVKVHDFVPHRYKVVHELLLGVLTSVDFRQGPELGVRTEDQVDTGAGPLECAALAITTLEYGIVLRRLPSTSCSCRADSRRSHW